MASFDPLRDKFKCDDCHREFVWKGELLAHIRTDHGAQEYPCIPCGISFSRADNLKRHEVSVHSSLKFKCGNCERQYSRRDALNRHEKNCKAIKFVCPRCDRIFEKMELLTKHMGLCPIPTCPTCQANFAAKDQLKDHRALFHSKKRKATPTASVSSVKKRKRNGSFHCSICLQSFETRKIMFQHTIQEHADPVIWQHHHTTLEDTGDSELEALLRMHRSVIYLPHDVGDVTSTFNFPLTMNVGNNHWLTEISQRLNQLAEINNTETYKMNFTLGFILVNRETGEYRFFAPGHNNSFFKKPIRIDRPTQWKKVFDELTTESLTQYVTHHRDDTKWLPLMVTNMIVEVYHLGVAMGNGSLAEFVKRSHCIVALEYDDHGRLYDDGLCAVRALAYHNNVKYHGNGFQNLENETRRLQTIWKKESLDLTEVNHFEDTFDIDVDIYTLCHDSAVIPRYLSEGLRQEKLVLNLHDTHLSYVSNVPGYLQKYKCSSCERHFEKMSNWKRHQGSCAKTTRFEFPGGYHKLNSTIFDRLEEFGIVIPSKQRTFPWFAVYDFESLLVPVHEEQRTEKLKWTRRHDVVSVSISSNVPCFRTPKAIVDPDPTHLIDRMMEYLGDISDSVHKLAKEKWHNVFTEMDTMLQECKAKVDDTVTGQAYEDTLKRLEALMGSFENYCRQCPVLAFNSAKYDVNLVKEHLLPWLQNDKPDSGDNEQNDDKPSDKEDEKQQLSVIKKGSAYSHIGSRRFKFLDICNYLAGGVNYAKFLKAFKVQESKSFFPYEWFDDVQKLEYPSLPPYEAFYSELKQCNVLDENDGQGRERHRQLMTIWREQNMATFKDFLVYYNNLDVGPFVEAVERMQEFYFDRCVDLFKIAISVPGIARRWLFQVAKEAGASFALIHRDDDDLYYTLKKNIVGGPSIIFTRHAEVGKTNIRRNPSKPCSNIVGFDANALYLWAIGEPMPCGGYVRRHAPHFKAEPRLRHEAMFHWLEFIQATEGIHILHQRNHSTEVRIGPYLVDGYDPVTKTVYEFHGCYYHGCRACGLDKSEQGEQRKKRTEEREGFLKTQKDQVQHIRVIWEHEFEAQIRSDPMLDSFVKNRIPLFFAKHRYDSVTTKQLLQAVSNDTLFGFLEVDIHVPTHLHQYFEEMSPLFCSADVKFADIGKYMQDYVRQRGLSEKPRRLLVGGMRARKILLSSPYLKWLLQKGLVVTHLYQVIEYASQRCFQKFMEDVSDARRSGDVDPDQAIIADTMKLQGNSAYGSLIMDKEKHQDVKYAEGKGQSQLLINDPSFRKCSRVGNDLYEIELAKNKIVFDLPIQLGYHILQLAKLRMLQFRFDFLEVFCNQSDFEYLEMDTDSAYLAIAGKKLEDIIHPSKQQELHNQKHQQCHNGDFTTSDGFFPRECCEKHMAYDKRTPGLFKVEAEGNAMIALCSKTYILRQDDGVKFSCKGLNKNMLINPYSIYAEVLESRQPQSVTNLGFQPRRNTIFTYQQVRSGISYFYCKREVMNDGIHTKPLAMELCPWPDKRMDVVDESHPWSLTSPRQLIVEGKQYTTLAAVCEAAMGADDPKAFVNQCLPRLPPYVPKGVIMVALTKELVNKNFKFWSRDSYWTTGLSPRSSTLRCEYPGQNQLAVLLDALVITALVDHTYL